MTNAKTGRNLHILYLYLGEGLTLQEIGDIYSISRERARQILYKFPEYRKHTQVQSLRKKINKENKRLAKALEMYRQEEVAREKFWKYVNIEPGCWEWSGYTHSVTKYGIVTNKTLSMAYGEKHRTLSHRLMWCISKGQQIPKGKFICHTCDNPSCVNPDHLYLGDAQSNVSDREERNNHKPFTRKLSDKEVENIRDIYQKEGMSSVLSLAKAYNVSGQYIYILGNSEELRNGKEGKRGLKGEKHPRAKLTANDVLELRKLYNTGDYSYKELIEKINKPISISALRNAVVGKTWNHI